MINSNHKPQQFLEDAGNVALERVRDAVERRYVKMNSAFNDEFATKDKRANKSLVTKNSEIYRFAHVIRAARIIEPILASLEEFQERDSGWALSRILNLTINVNKLNPVARDVISKCHEK